MNLDHLCTQMNIKQTIYYTVKYVWGAKNNTMLCLTNKLELYPHISGNLYEFQAAKLGFPITCHCLLCKAAGYTERRVCICSHKQQSVNSRFAKTMSNVASNLYKKQHQGGRDITLWQITCSPKILSYT